MGLYNIMADADIAKGKLCTHAAFPSLCKYSESQPIGIIGTMPLFIQCRIWYITGTEKLLRT